MTATPNERVALGVAGAPNPVTPSSAGSPSVPQAIPDAEPPLADAELIEEQSSSDDDFASIVDWRLPATRKDKRKLCGVEVERVDEPLDTYESWTAFAKAQGLSALAKNGEPEIRATVCGDTCGMEACQEGCESEREGTMGCGTDCSGPAPWLAHDGAEIVALLPTPASRLLSVPVGHEQITMRYRVRSQVSFARAGELFVFQNTDPDVETEGVREPCEYMCTFGRLISRSRTFQVVDRSSGRRILWVRLPKMKYRPPKPYEFSQPDEPKLWATNVVPLVDGVAIDTGQCSVRVRLQTPPPTEAP
jgi:hypothetical protein